MEGLTDRTVPDQFLLSGVPFHRRGAARQGPFPVIVGEAVAEEIVGMVEDDRRRRFAPQTPPQHLQVQRQGGGGAQTDDGLHRHLPPDLGRQVEAGGHQFRVAQDLDRPGGEGLDDPRPLGLGGGAVEMRCRHPRRGEVGGYLLAVANRHAIKQGAGPRGQLPVVAHRIPGQPRLVDRRLQLPRVIVPPADTHPGQVQLTRTEGAVATEEAVRHQPAWTGTTHQGAEQVAQRLAIQAGRGGRQPEDARAPCPVVVHHPRPGGGHGQMRLVDHQEVRDRQPLQAPHQGGDTGHGHPLRVGIGTPGDDQRVGDAKLPEGRRGLVQQVMAMHREHHPPALARGTFRDVGADDGLAKAGGGLTED